MSTHPIDRLCEEMGLLERLKQTKKAYEFEIQVSKELLSNGQEYPGIDRWVDDIKHLDSAIAQLEVCQQSVIEQWASSNDERYQLYAAAADDFSVLKF